MPFPPTGDFPYFNLTELTSFHMLRIGQDVFGFIRGLKIELICIKISPLCQIPRKAGLPLVCFPCRGQAKEGFYKTMSPLLGDCE